MINWRFGGSTSGLVLVEIWPNTQETASGFTAFIVITTICICIAVTNTFCSRGICVRWTLSWFTDYKESSKKKMKCSFLQPKTTILSIYFACILQRNCYFRVRRIVVQLRKPNRRHKRDPDRDLSNRTAGILRSRTFSIHRRNSTAGCIDRVVLGICLHPSRFSKIKIHKTIYY